MKNEFIKGQYRTTLPLFCPQNTHFRLRGPMQILSNHISALNVRESPKFSRLIRNRGRGTRRWPRASDFRPEVEIWPFCACAMHPAIIIGTPRSLWTRLWWQMPRSTERISSLFQTTEVRRHTHKTYNMSRKRNIQRETERKIRNTRIKPIVQYHYHRQTTCWQNLLIELLLSEHPIFDCTTDATA